MTFMAFAMAAPPLSLLEGSPMGDKAPMVYTGPNFCLGCNERIDGASEPFEGGSPNPGDVTVCIYCGHIMVFGEGLKLRNPDDDEIKEIAGDRRILAIQRARARMKEDDDDD
jgi:hypothetical protein